VGLVEELVHGDVLARRRANDQLRQLLAADADFTEAAARGAELLTQQSGKELLTLLAVINRHPPADWPTHGRELEDRGLPPTGEAAQAPAEGTDPRPACIVGCD